MLVAAPDVPESIRHLLSTTPLPGFMGWLGWKLGGLGVDIQLRCVGLALHQYIDIYVSPAGGDLLQASLVDSRRGVTNPTVTTGRTALEAVALALASLLPQIRKPNVPDFTGKSKPYSVRRQVIGWFNLYTDGLWPDDCAVATAKDSDLQWDEWAFDDDEQVVKWEELLDLDISFPARRGPFELRGGQDNVIYRSDTPTYKEAFLAWCWAFGVVL